MQERFEPVIGLFFYTVKNPCLETAQTVVKAKRNWWLATVNKNFN